MAVKRASISFKTKLASALAHIAGIPMDHAKNMSPDHVISLFNFDHVVLHAHGGSDEFWNLTPMLISEHRHKTARIDVPRYAKGERLKKEHEQFRQLLLTPRDQRPPRRSRWASRPFPSRRKKP